MCVHADVCVCDIPANLCLLQKSSSEESDHRSRNTCKRAFIPPQKPNKVPKSRHGSLFGHTFWGGGISALFSPRTKRNYGVFYQLVLLGKYRNVYIIHEITSGIPPIYHFNAHYESIKIKRNPFLHMTQKPEATKCQ